MTILEKAVSIVKATAKQEKARLSRNRKFALASLVENALWIAYSRNWNKNYSDVQEALSQLQHTSHVGGQLWTSTMDAIRDFPKWHTPLDEVRPDPRQEKDVRFSNTTAYAMYDAMGCPLAAYVPKQFSGIDIAVFNKELLSDEDAAEIRSRLRALEESGKYVVASFWAPDANDLKGNLGVED